MSKIRRVSEIFKEASGIRLKKERIEFLQQNADMLMRYVVQGAYHPGVVWLLPKGIPPFRRAESIGAENVFHQQLSNLYLFCEGGMPTLKQYNREKMFIDLLEKLHPDDALLMCAVKDKKINYPFLTYTLFRDAFPDWLPEKLNEKENENV